MVKELSGKTSVVDVQSWWCAQSCLTRKPLSTGILIFSSEAPPSFFSASWWGWGTEGLRTSQRTPEVLHSTSPGESHPRWLFVSSICFPFLWDLWAAKAEAVPSGLAKIIGRLETWVWPKGRLKAAHFQLRVCDSGCVEPKSCHPLCTSPFEVLVRQSIPGQGASIYKG